MLFLRRKNIARFEKVSYEEFRKSIIDLYLDDNLKKKVTACPNFFKYGIIYESEEERVQKIENYIRFSYDRIIIPETKTSGSAGHDITVPFDFGLDPLFRNGSVFTKNCTMVIPTGLKVFIKKGWVLECYPRSGWGIRGLKIENTVPIIDWDYYNNSKNEGHLLLKITNESKIEEEFEFTGGDTSIIQGLFKIYGTAGKPNKNKREGGFNSTSKEGSILIK